MDNVNNAKRELVVNWHITEACNYKCSYCFAKWDRQKNEVMNDEAATIRLLDEISKLPKILNNSYPTDFNSIRLNLVGGETFLSFRKVSRIIHHAKQRNFNLSAITNGSRLNDELIDLIAMNFCSIGFSLDSLDNQTNLTIGRSEKNNPMDVMKLSEDINTIKKLNPDIDIKVNTVVSNLNKAEDLSSFIKKIDPDKWKIFKVLPIITEENNISQSDFSQFLDRHNEFDSIISSEDNDEMTDSYLMIDPVGKFFQNSNTTKGYIYSRPIIEIGIRQAFSEIKFNPEKFHGRYKSNYIDVLELS